MNFDDDFLEDKNHHKKTKSNSIVRENKTILTNEIDIEKIMNNINFKNICQIEKSNYNTCKKNKFSTCEASIQSLLLCIKNNQKIRIQRLLKRFANRINNCSK